MDLWSEKLLGGKKKTVDWTSIGTLTSNGVLGQGEYAASSEPVATSGFDAYQAFNSISVSLADITKVFRITSSRSNNCKLIYYSAKPIYLSSFSFYFIQPEYGDVYQLSSGLLEASNDGNNWTTLLSGIPSYQDSSTPKLYTIDTKKGYKYFRLNLTAAANQSCWWLIIAAELKGKREV